MEGKGGRTGRANQSNLSPLCKQYDYNVALAGAYGVGKTSLFRRMFNLGFCEGKPPSGFESDIHTETFAEESTVIGLRIWDTVDMEKHGSITQSYYRGSHFVLLVYSANDEFSLQKLEEVADNARNYEPMTKLILVRNKTDLPIDSDGVTPDREDRFVRNMKHRIRARFSTSAKNNEGIQELLRVLAKHALKMLKSGDKKPIDYSSDPFAKLHLGETPKSGNCCS